jgi:hypothetical protein
LTGLEQAIRDYEWRIISAGFKIAWALIDGIIEGLGDLGWKLKDAVVGLAGDAVGWFAGAIGADSPATEFIKMGHFMGEGLVVGLGNSSGMVQDAVESTANTAITTMRDAIRNMSGMVTDELNVDPTITPILDLTQVRGQVSELARLTDVTPISVAASRRAAVAISSAQVASEEEAAATAAVGPSVNFQQNNYSPKALSPVEIYRLTRNQLSQVKSALAVT